MSADLLHHLLLYAYVEDMAQRREAHRDAHLQRIRILRDEGTIIMAGALGDPPTGGALVWRGATLEKIEAFVRDDPYREAGLITAYRIEPWTLV